MRVTLAPKTVATAIAVVAAAGLFLSIQRTSQTVSAPRTAERVEAAQSIATAFDQLFASAEAQTATIAAVLEPWRPDSPDQLQLLGRLLGTAPLLDGLLVVDDSGTVATSDPGNAQLIGRPVEDPEAGGGAAGRIARSGVVEDPLTGERVVLIRAPIRAQDGGPPAILRASLPVSALADQLAAMGLPDGAVAAVLVAGAVGLPIVLWLAWAFDLTGDGIRRTRGR